MYQQMRCVSLVSRKKHLVPRVALPSYVYNIVLIMCMDIDDQAGIFGGEQGNACRFGFRLAQAVFAPPDVTR